MFSKIIILVLLLTYAVAVFGQTSVEIQISNVTDKGHTIKNLGIEDINVIVDEMAECLQVVLSTGVV